MTASKRIEASRSNECWAQTRTIAIDATPDAVLNLVADDWLIEGVGAESLITVRVSRAQGTLDLLAAGDHRHGAFSRVLPNGDGSQYIFTLFFPHETPEPAIAAQMAVVEVELQTVRRLSEHHNN